MISQIFMDGFMPRMIAADLSGGQVTEVAMNELHFLGADQYAHVIICVSFAAEHSTFPLGRATKVVRW
jgi:hypothetical protein